MLGASEAFFQGALEERGPVGEDDGQPANLVVNRRGLRRRRRRRGHLLKTRNRAGPIHDSNSRLRLKITLFDES